MKVKKHIRRKRSFIKKVKKAFAVLRKDSFVVYPIGFSFMVALFSVLYLFYLSSHMPSEIPLFYSLPFGQERLATSRWILIIPSTIIICICVNMLFTLLSPFDKVLVRLLSLSVAFISFLGFYTMIRIIMLIS